MDEKVLLGLQPPSEVFVAQPRSSETREMNISKDHKIKALPRWQELQHCCKQAEFDSERSSAGEEAFTTLESKSLSWLTDVASALLG